LTTNAPAGSRHPVLERVFGTVPGVRWLVGGIVGISLACSILARILAPDDFPTLGRSMWWAIQTVTTVGYGDAVPASSWGKSIGAILMVSGVAGVSILTAAIAAAWVTRAQAKRMATLQATHADPVLAALERIEQRLDDLEARIERGSRE
jgi:voltage-gated potassium channel